MITQRGGDGFLLARRRSCQGVFASGGGLEDHGVPRTWSQSGPGAPAIPGQQWLGGIQYGNERFVATGGRLLRVKATVELERSGGTEDAAEPLAGVRQRQVRFGDVRARGGPADGAAWAEGSGGHNNQVAFCGDFKNTSVARAPPATARLAKSITVRINNSGRLPGTPCRATFARAHHGPWIERGFVRLRGMGQARMGQADLRAGKRDSLSMRSVPPRVLSTRERLGKSGGSHGPGADRRPGTLGVMGPCISPLAEKRACG